MENSKPPPPNAKDVIKRGGRLIKVGGPVDRSCVTLRFAGDSLDPDALSRLLGVRPTDARRKGDVIPDRRYHRIATTGMWRLEGALLESTNLEQQVLALLDSVTGDLRTWQDITAKYRADILVGVFLTAWNRGFSLSPKISRMLSDRNIAIGFDIYSQPRKGPNKALQPTPMSVTSPAAQEPRQP